MDIKSRFKILSETPAIYRFTVETVSLAEKAAEQEEKETEKLKCWTKAFHDVVEEALKEKPIHQPQHSNETQETKRHRTSSTLFRPASPGRINEEVEKFREWLGELNQTLAPHTQARTLHIKRRA